MPDLDQLARWLDETNDVGRKRFDNAKKRNTTSITDSPREQWLCRSTEKGSARANRSMWEEDNALFFLHTRNQCRYSSKNRNIDGRVCQAKRWSTSLADMNKTQSFEQRTDMQYNSTDVRIMVVVNKTTFMSSSSYTTDNQEVSHWFVQSCIAIADLCALSLTHQRRHRLVVAAANQRSKGFRFVFVVEWCKSSDRTKNFPRLETSEASFQEFQAHLVAEIQWIESLFEVLQSDGGIRLITREFCNDFLGDDRRFVTADFPHLQNNWYISLFRQIVLPSSWESPRRLLWTNVRRDRHRTSRRRRITTIVEERNDRCYSKDEFNFANNACVFRWALNRFEICFGHWPTRGRWSWSTTSNLFVLTESTHEFHELIER